MLDEPLEEYPKISASYEEYMERFWTTYLKVKWMMCTFMNSDLSRQFKDLTAMEIVGGLKIDFQHKLEL